MNVAWWWEGVDQDGQNSITHAGNESRSEWSNKKTCEWRTGTQCALHRPSETNDRAHRRSFKAAQELKGMTESWGRGNTAPGVFFAFANIVFFSCALLILRCVNILACSINIVGTKLTANRNALQWWRGLRSRSWMVGASWEEEGTHAPKLDDRLWQTKFQTESWMIDSYRRFWKVASPCCH